MSVEGDPAPTTAAHRPPVAVAPDVRWALVALCVTVTTSYGVLFYAFTVLAPAISADTGWSLAWVTAAFSGGQVVAAVLGAPVGRWLDAAGPRVVMTAAAVVAVPAVVAVASARSVPVFVAAWLVAGLAMAGLFYPPAFAALTVWYGTARVRALTILTLAAGLSSTVFAPLTAALEGRWGWRGTYLVLAVVLLVVVVPLHAVALRPRWPHLARDRSGGLDPHVRAVAGGRAFVALTVAMTLGGFAVYAVLVNLVPLLTEQGITAGTAAWALGVGGIGQVLGRLVYAPLDRRTPPVGRTVVVLAVCAATTGLLAVVARPVALVLVVSLVAGVARGIYTLLQATAVSDRWGTYRFGTLNGILHTPVVLAIALAPWAGAALAGPLGGFPAVFGVLAAIGAVGAAAAVLSGPSADAPRQDA